MHLAPSDPFHGFERRIHGDAGGAVSSEILGSGRNRTNGQTRYAVEVAGHGKTGFQAFDRSVTDTACEFIHRHKTDDRPFGMVVGWMLPHNPVVCAKDRFDYYVANIPPLEPESDTYLDALHPALKVWRERRGVSTLSPQQCRQALAAYYGLVEEADANVGRLVDAVRSGPDADNTIIIYTSDHGDMAHEHGMWWKSNFYEGAANVPCILSWPNHFSEGLVVDEIASLIDIGPTILDLAGAPPLPDVSGRSFARLLQGDAIPDWPNEIFCEYSGLLGDQPSCMVRSGKWKLNYYSEFDSCQLFDLDSDPDERNDIGTPSRSLNNRSRTESQDRRPLVRQPRPRRDGQAGTGQTRHQRRGSFLSSARCGEFRGGRGRQRLRLQSTRGTAEVDVELQRGELAVRSQRSGQMTYPGLVTPSIRLPSTVNCLPPMVFFVSWCLRGSASTEGKRMSSKNEYIPEHVYDYILSNTLRDRPELKALRDETVDLPGAGMQISADQGQFMSLLVNLIGAKKAIEVGTFTGYSALVVAQALPADGLLVACDIDDEMPSIGQRHWESAGIAAKIDLRIGPAVESLDALITDGQSGTFDMAFIDADKENYGEYYERCLVLLRQRGLILIDNVLWGGRTADPSHNEESTVAIRELTKKMQADERVDFSLIPVGDGLSLAVKR